MSDDPIVLDKHVTHDGLGIALVATAFQPNDASCSVCLSTVDVFADTRGGPAITMTAEQVRGLAGWLDRMADAWGPRRDGGRGDVVLLLAVVVLVVLVVGGVVTGLSSALGNLTDQVCAQQTSPACEGQP